VALTGARALLRTPGPSPRAYPHACPLLSLALQVTSAGILQLPEHSSRKQQEDELRRGALEAPAPLTTHTPHPTPHTPRPQPTRPRPTRPRLHPPAATQSGLSARRSPHELLECGVLPSPLRTAPLIAHAQRELSRRRNPDALRHGPNP
jgi:hypothetical protein